MEPGRRSLPCGGRVDGGQGGRSYCRLRSLTVSYGLLLSVCYGLLLSVPQVAALFPSEGSEYARMFEEAAINWPPVRSAVSAMDAATAAVGPAGSPLASDLLFPRERCAELYGYM